LTAITFFINAPTAPEAICDLREAVGWDRDEEAYPAAFKGYWATVSSFDAAGNLQAWCAILSDGIRHAVLLDVIVHPAHQRQGVGRALVTRAIEHIKAHGINIIHVDFLPEHAQFYKQCGFDIGLGGIYEG
jgi:GNAT superfamily N-acetyltransferase